MVKSGKPKKNTSNGERKKTSKKNSRKSVVQKDSRANGNPTLPISKPKSEVEKLKAPTSDYALFITSHQFRGDHMKSVSANEMQQMMMPLLTQGDSERLAREFREKMERERNGMDVIAYGEWEDFTEEDLRREKYLEYKAQMKMVGLEEGPIEIDAWTTSENPYLTWNIYLKETSRVDPEMLTNVVNFEKIFLLLGSLFDPAKEGLQEELFEMLTPVEVESLKFCYHKLLMSMAAQQFDQDLDDI